MAGEVLSRGLEERLSNQIGKQVFISNLLPSAQPAPAFKEGESKTKIQIKYKFNYKSNQIKIPTVSIQIHQMSHSKSKMLKTQVPQIGSYRRSNGS
jgi:hypothetical protein